MSVNAGDGYAGDVTPEEAWAILEDRPDSVLVDVRTHPEWMFVGIPDLSQLGKKVILQSWQRYPEMARNDRFEADIEEMGLSRDAPVLFLCRSGQRSRAAAMALTALGYEACYNVAHGFEGDPDGQRHRGRLNGWKASELPWTQQ